MTTRIESLVDSIETLTNAIIDARLLPGNANKHACNKAHRAVVDARADVAAGLREFTMPMVRVIDGGPQPFMTGLRDGDKPTCKRCRAQKPCVSTCADWATAVRSVVAAAKGES